MSSIAIVIPSYDEFDNLQYLLPKIKNSIKENFSSHDVEVVIVDGLKKDQKTKFLCENFGFNYLNRDPSNQFGDAIRSGINFVRNSNQSNEWLIIMDSDGSHDPSLFREFNSFINNNEPDIVIASRYVQGGSTENNIVLITLSMIVNLIYKFSFNLRVNDISNNFRLYRFSYLKDIELLEQNFDIVEEILIKILKKFPDLNIIEIPSTFLKRKHGKSKRNLILFSFTYLRSIKRLRKFSK